jgi:hypothetical protein
VNFSSGEDALEALAALGAKLETRGARPVSLLICGGAALNISGLSSIRLIGTTKAGYKADAPIFI